MGYPAIAIKDNLYKLLYTPQEQYNHTIPAGTVVSPEAGRTSASK